MKFFTAWFTMLIVSLLLLPALSFAAVPAPIQLYMDGSLLKPEVAPRILNDNTIVPIRIIAETLGTQVAWDEKLRKVTLGKDKTKIELVIDKKQASVNGKEVTLETPPVIIEDNTLLPIRFVSENLGVTVKWDEPTRSVHLFKPAKPAAEEPAKADKEEKPAAPVSAGSGNSQSGGPVKAGEPAAVPGGKTETDTGGKETVKDADKDTDKDVDQSIEEDEKEAEEDEDSGSLLGTGAPIILDPVNSGDKEAVKLATIEAIALKSDTLSIQTSGGTVIKPTVFRLGGPERLVIDLPGSQLGSALTANLGGLKEGKLALASESVTGVRYSLFSKEKSIVRIVLDVARRSELKFSAGSNPGEILGTITAGKLKPRVMIDAGHGATDPGALSVNGRKEKDLVLAVSNKVTALLKQDSRLEVVTIRTDDSYYYKPAARAEMANQADADLFVSIHANKASKESIRGTETYYYTTQSESFAKLMHKYVLEGTGFPDRKVKIGDFAVIRESAMPSVLLELGFLSNRTEEDLMYQDGFQDRVAASIVAAIKKQLNLD